MECQHPHKLSNSAQQQDVKRTNRQQPVKGFIFITRNDKERLLALLSVAKSINFRDRVDLNGLAVKLKLAFIVDARLVIDCSVVLNSVIQCPTVDVPVLESVEPWVGEHQRDHPAQEIRLCSTDR